MPSRDILFGLTLTAGAAVTALLLTTAFSISSEGPLIRLVIGGLITTAELVFQNAGNDSWANRSLLDLVTRSYPLFHFGHDSRPVPRVEYTLIARSPCPISPRTMSPAYALRHGTDIFGPNLRELGFTLFHFEALDNYHPPFTALFFCPFLPALSLGIHPVEFISLLLYIGLGLLLLQSYGLLTAAMVALILSASVMGALHREHLPRSTIRRAFFCDYI